MYVLLGDPIPLARARFGKNRIVYDSQKVLKISTAITLEKQHVGPLLTGPINLDITFYMRIPKSASAKHKAKLQGNDHISRPDLDNLIKWICDICLNVVYLDDCIISKITARKIYDNNPRTEFTMEKKI